MTKKEFFERLEDAASATDLMEFLLEENLVGYEDVVGAFGKELWENKDILGVGFEDSEQLEMDLYVGEA